jgi:dynein heavy chain, axonemal
MNPGYQGRQELPENLKVLFRVVAMMVPDRETIIRVKLCSVGYQNFSELARKFNTLYSLCEQQLSKQKHYDFGLRNMLSVLRSAGAIKRNRITDPEEELLMSTLRDMNLSKLVSQDVSLFKLLLQDIFPGIGSSLGQQHRQLLTAISQVIETENLIQHPSWTTKVVQLYETTQVRHGIMMVGPSGCGKSKIISVLQDSLTKFTSIVHKRTRMNPKAIRVEEMFGETDKYSGEWVDGIFASIWTKYNDRNRKDVHWIICDGPIDAIWIENLNTVLDDNRILTLANGDRIPMVDSVKLVFEVEDMQNASPATVSRAGIIFVSSTDLDWEPVVQSWLKSKPGHISSLLQQLFIKYVGNCDGVKNFGHLFQHILKTCKAVINVTRVAIIENCCKLLDGLLDNSVMAHAFTSEDSVEMERLFLYTLMWSFGGIFEEEDRLRLTQYFFSLSESHQLTKILPDLNNGGNIFDYHVNTSTMRWERWSVPTWEYPSFIEDPNFSSILVPTVESVRSTYLLSILNRRDCSVLITGSAGTAKTSIANMFLESLQSSGDSTRVKKMCFSYATTPALLQSSFESELDKRGGKSFGPSGGRKMTVFLDDLNMPEHNVWGDQPTLELVRQLLEYSSFYFLDKDKRGDLKNIEDIRYLAAMNHSGSRRQDIPNRLKRHFFILNMILPSTQSIYEVFGQMLQGRFHLESSQFSQAVKSLPNATVRLWNAMREKMLPSPLKFHYTFNLRDISRIFHGILRTPKQSLPNTRSLLFLWRHESERIFGDKLINAVDKSIFMAELNKTSDEVLSLVNPAAQPEAPTLAKRPSFAQSGNKNQSSSKNSTASMKPAPINTRKVTTININPMSPLDQDKLPHASSPNTIRISKDELRAEEVLFVDFMREDEYDEDGVLIQEAPKIYEQGGSMENIRERVQLYLDRYNELNSSKSMNLVLFDDAMRHLLRICRCLGMEKGNMLLVGVGGSGKQSLTRLASYCSGSTLFQITISKSYNLNSFLEDIRAIYKSCGLQGIKTTFLITEAEIKDEAYLEIINSILVTGEVSNLFPKDEFLLLASELRPIAVKQIPNYVDTPDNLVKFFIERVRSNLHVVMCMSPLSSKFTERCHRFPGIIGGCTIDWHMPWPNEALISVSRRYLSNLQMDHSCTSSIKEALICHMGMVHQLIVRSCEDYYLRMRRRVYQTPKSFLQFLSDYSVMYQSKYDELIQKASRVEIGLEKLQSGANDVEKMKVSLADEEIKLKESELAANRMLHQLEISSMEAKREADAVSKIKEGCQLDAERIAGEKADAEEDLAKAQPFLDEAERAVSSIKPNDLNELKKLGKPSDIIKLIFDCVSILKMAPLVKIEPVEVTLGVGKEKRSFMFLKDSYKIVQSGMLSDARFLASIMQFSRVEKDFINEETIEFLAPYLALDGFTPMVAKNASKAAEGLCAWARAMADYHEASKIVKPKLEALRLAEARLQDAERELFRAETRLKGCQDVLDALQADFDNQLAYKRAIEENTYHTKKRMEQATSLIQGLAGERTRWNHDREEFVMMKQRLVGDVAMACAIIAYCGPFHQDYRQHILNDLLTSDLSTRRIPYTSTFDFTEFLVDIGTIGDWNMEGLPTDTLSIQNGILVTRCSRYPLLIDPQGQALQWILRHEENRMPPFGATSFTNTRFREQLEYCLAEGKTLIITGIEEEFDPILIPLLERQIVNKAKNKYVSIGGRLCDYNEKFFLYLITRHPNPVFSPEDQSRCTMVDFTVTQKGFEEQLLGRVIQKEQRSLEESLKVVFEDVTNNTKILLRFDQMLLERLSENTGNLLDDEELIMVLADTKAKAIDVRDKLTVAADMKKNIYEKREQYRPIATRGSILYFSIMDMSRVNSMYQTSLDQFQHIFDKALDLAEKSSLPSKRIYHVIDSVTFHIYRYINRGLYQQHKIIFQLFIAFKILLSSSKISNNEISFFIRGNSLGMGQAAANIRTKSKAYNFLSNETWLCMNDLSKSNPHFSSLLEDIENNESSFVPWFQEVEPERFPIPVVEAKWLGVDDIVVQFNRLLAIRCMREDRTILAINLFLRRFETIDLALPTTTGNSTFLGNNAGFKLPAFGSKYMEAHADNNIEAVYKETDVLTPVIYLLSAGTDPTDSIETFARKKRKDLECVSMGEGQDLIAYRAITAAITNGSWVLIQNAHLGLQFMESLEEILIRLRQPDAVYSQDFRLFITTEPHPKFSIGLLQMSLKVTNESPKGLRAGLYKSYTVHIDQDRLERIESSTWRTFLFTICFLHSIVQERRKYGALGWCVPYEFNDSDLHATIMFLEKHLEFASTISYSTIQYMISKIQYGGRITDSLDRRLFAGYTEFWFTPHTQPIDHWINKIPDYMELDEYLGYINKFPIIDSPEMMGLHSNADLSFRYKEVNQLFDTILSIQPQQASSNQNQADKDRDDRGSNDAVASKDHCVSAKCLELIKSIPTDDIFIDINGHIEQSLGSLDIPLNIFLSHELHRFHNIYKIIKQTLQLIIQAIRGELVTTTDLIDAMDAINDNRVPKSWIYNAAGDEISWFASNLSSWFQSFYSRDHQYRQWLSTGTRPHSFWIAGFFNQQGYFTSIQQEIARTKKSENCAFDQMIMHAEVSDIMSTEHIRNTPRVSTIHLFAHFNLASL